MRHHAEHPSRRVQHAGDIVPRAIGRGADVTEGDAAFALEFGQGLGIGEIIALIMGDRNANDFILLVAGGKDAVAALHRQGNVAAEEFEIAIAHQDAGQQAAFGEHLEAVANAEDRDPGARLGDDVAHHRRLRRHRAAAQIVAVGKAAGKDNQIERGQGGFAMPDHRRRAPARGLQCYRRIAVAVRSGKNDDRSLHSRLALQALARSRNFR